MDATTTCPCGGDHPEGAVYFVTCCDGDRTGLLLGPYDTHPEALDHVDQGRRIAERVNAWAAFYAFGTAAIKPGPKTFVGVLNDLAAQEEGAVLCPPPAPKSKRKHKIVDHYRHR